MLKIKKASIRTCNDEEITNLNANRGTDIITFGKANILPETTIVTIVTALLQI